MRKNGHLTEHFKFYSQNDNSSAVLINSNVRKVRKMLEYSSDFSMGFFWSMEALLYSKNIPYFMIINNYLIVKTKPNESHILTIEPAYEQIVRDFNSFSDTEDAKKIVP